MQAFGIVKVQPEEKGTGAASLIFVSLFSSTGVGKRNVHECWRRDLTNSLDHVVEYSSASRSFKVWLPSSSLNGDSVLIAHVDL